MAPRPLLSWLRFPHRLVLVAALGMAAALAHATEYSLREWHPLDGLPTEEAGGVLQGRDGHLWVMTTGGLVRFDGAQFELITPRDEGGQVRPLVRTLAETPLHGIVVAPVTGGLLAFQDGVWRPVPLSDATTGRVVTTLFAGPDGALWVGCGDGLLVRIGADGPRVFQTQDGLHGRAVFTFAVDDLSRLWIANGIFLHRYEAGHLTDPPQAFGRSELRIGSSPTGGPWIAMDGNLGRITDGKPVLQATLPPLLGAHYIQVIHEDRQGTLWIGTRSQGMFTFGPGGLQHVTTSHEEIFSVTSDAEGNLWTATNGGGLNRLRPKVFSLYDKAAGLGDNFSDTVCQDRDGTMWFGNRDGGVAFLRSGELARVSNPPEWPILSAVSVSPHPDGGIWSSAGAGLFRIANAVNPQMTAIPLPRLPIIRITLTTRDGSLWLSAEPDRVARLKDGKLRIFGPEDGFPPRQVRFLAEDVAGRLWCSTAQGDLLRFTGERFEPVPTEVSTGVINAVHFDNQGNPWLGTERAGLVVRLDGRWRALDERHGLPGRNITQILADDRGYLWFGSIRGIYRASEKELRDCLEGRSPQVHAVLLGKDEGLKELSCFSLFQPAAWKSRDGLLWFATRKGVLRLDPALATPDAPPPPARIVEVRVDGQSGPPAPRIEIAANLHKLEIRFSALCLATPERVQVRYRLDGFDDDWINAAAGRVATYPRLPPGEYTFRVAASFGHGSREGRSDALVLVITPLWWQTWWWRTLTVGAAFGLVWLAVRAWSHRRLRQKLERLERASAVERERIRIAQNIHDDIGASLTRISLLTQSVQREDSEHAADLEKIYQTASEITRSLDETVWAVNPKYDDLESLVYYVGNFAQQFLAVAQIRCRLDIAEGLPALALSSQARHHLFLCCKEALNNVVKHATATTVALAVAAADGCFRIVITDNGCGLGAPGAIAGDRIATGHGLANLRTRMIAVGGHAVIEPAAAGGTTVRLEIPLDALPKSRT